MATQYSKYIGELILYLQEDQKTNNPKLWQSINNLVKYKKAKYNRKLFDPITGKGVIDDIEVAQDKFINSLCSFGLTKDEVVYILSSDPTKIKEIKLSSFTKEQDQELIQKEYDFGYLLKRIEKENAQDKTKRGLATLLNIPNKYFPTAKGKGEKAESHILEWPSDIAEITWLNLPRSQKGKLIIDLWMNKDNSEYSEFTKLNFVTIERLFQYYTIQDHKQTEIDGQIEKDSAILKKDNKYEKILKYSNKETQCDNAPAFFGKQSDSDIWQYAKNENPGYFSALSEYSAINDILNKIETIIKDTATPAGKKKYFDQLIKAIEIFDFTTLGSSRDDLKQWLFDEVVSFLDLWTVFRKKHLNITLEGPPGSGKTTIAEGLGPIFSKLGILLIGKYKIVSRSDLVGQYIGETANKVKGILNSMMESVLFIDEAYAIACSNPITSSNDTNIQFDQYGIEAINEIVNFLDKNSGSVMIIAAGYERDMQSCFFGANVGIERRFPKRYRLVDMPADDLSNIFINRLKDTVQNTNIDETLTQGAQICINQLFQETPMYWVNQSGDMINLAAIIAGKKAARNQPLDAIDIYNTITEMFSTKDLSRMQNLPQQIEQEKMANWGINKIQSFLNDQSYLSEQELETLKSMLTTGDRIEKLVSSDIDWMDPASKYNLIETIKEEKKRSNLKIKDFFNTKSNEYCNKPRPPPPQQPGGIMNAIFGPRSAAQSQRRSNRFQ